MEMIPLAPCSIKVADRRAFADNLVVVKPENELTNPLHKFGTHYCKTRFPYEAMTMSTTLDDLDQIPGSYFMLCN